MNQLIRRVAERSNHPDYKHAAIYIEGARILAHAANFDHKHAEERCLRKVSKIGKRGVLLSGRVSPDGQLRMARPCSRCEASLRKAGVRLVRYTNELGEWVEMEV